MAGFEVRVQGDLPSDVLERIGAAVRRAVLDAVAELDIAPPLYEWPLSEPAKSKFLVDPSDLTQTIGITVEQAEPPLDPVGE